MKAPSTHTLKITLFVLGVMLLVCAPFLFLGEEYVLPLLESRGGRVGALVTVAIALLAADSVAPVPATIVIMFLAWKAGWVAGVVGGTVGMSLGVLVAGWFGREAVGRIAPRFVPDAALARLREALQRRLGLTLACFRSVPVMAETSVIVAAATGVPLRRIFWATLLPNFAVALVYSAAAAMSQSAQDSGATAAIAFLATMAASYALWRWLGRTTATAPAS